MRTPWQELWRLTRCGKRASSRAGFTTSWRNSQISQMRESRQAWLAVVVEQARVAFADEDHAAGRGPHDVVIPFEQCIHAFGERLGVALESCIGHRLSAAGLVERVVHVAAHAAEQFAGSASHFGVDGVDVTGDEQSDFHTLRFVFASRILGDTSKIAVFPGKCSPAAHSAAGMRIRKGDRTLRYGPLAGCAVASCGASGLI